MRALLVPLDDAPAFDLAKELTLIGRNEDCDIRFDHKSVSKLHCVLVKTDGLILVRDLGSTNGTRVNGQRVRRAALLPNDQLAIAAFKYKVKFGDGPDEPVKDVVDSIPESSMADDDSDEREMPEKAGGPAMKRNALPDMYPDAPPKK